MSIDKIRKALNIAMGYISEALGDSDSFILDKKINTQKKAVEEALAELDKPSASDAREFIEATDGETYEVIPDDRTLSSLLHEMWEDYTDDIEENSLRIAIYRNARERKAREDTARKCADAANKAISAYLDAADMCDCGHLSVDQTGGFELLVERAILEAVE